MKWELRDMAIHRYNSKRACDRGRRVPRFVGYCKVVSLVDWACMKSEAVSPYAEGLSVQFVEGADVLPSRLIDALDVGQVLDYGTTEVDCKVCAIVVTASGPGLVSRVFARLLWVVG